MSTELRLGVDCANTRDVHVVIVAVLGGAAHFVDDVGVLSQVAERDLRVEAAVADERAHELAEVGLQRVVVLGAVLVGALHVDQVRQVLQELELFLPVLGRVEGAVRVPARFQARVQVRRAFELAVLLRGLEEAV